MNTTTATPTRKHAGTDVSFETRLELASIAIDVAMSKYGTSPQVPAWAPANPSEPAADTAGNSEDVLRMAAQVIRARGWNQGDYNRSDGALCALDAIRVVSGGDYNVSLAASTVLMNRIEKIHGDRYRTIWQWNDAPDRTWVQVTGMMERL